MKTWSVYTPLTGLFTGRRLSGSDETFLRENLPEGTAALEGEHDHVTLRVVDGKTVPREAPDGHTWMHAAEKFVPSSRLAAAEEDRAARTRIAELESKQHRPHRELALDPTNAAARAALQSIEAEIAALRSKVKTPFNL
jgi:hypothetical protein